MRILYFDCPMGAAGDMMTAALYELLSEDGKNEFIDRINSIGPEGVRVSAKKSVKCGITGTHMEVLIDGLEEHEHEHHHEHEHGHEHHHEHEHDHHHSSPDHIYELIDSMDIPPKAARDAKAVYALIAEAESHVHDTDIKDIHFHEVGTKDAVIDVVSVCILIDMLKPDKILASPIHVGSGTVKCMHGILPVPAPATAYILKGVPVYGGRIPGELTTPTGAALLRHFVESFGDLPCMSIDGTGYGMGTKDFDTANCLRAFIGQTEDKADETVAVLMCNVDDMSGEDIGFACERFLEEGAHEAFTIPVTMKKSRPGHLIEVICSDEKAPDMIKLMFKHTTTIGIRRFEYRRYVLKRKQKEIKTADGDIRVKVSEGYGVTREKYEYEDLKRLAVDKDMSLAEVREYLRNSPTS